jgi:hypothetical protein
MYFDFTNLRNSTNNQKIVPKIISWDKLFNDTSLQKYKKTITKIGNKRINQTRKALTK